MKITILALVLAICILSLQTGLIEGRGGRGGSSGRGGSGRGSSGRGSTGRGSTGRGSTGRGSTGRGSSGRGSTGRGSSGGSSILLDGDDFINSGNSTVGGEVGGIITGVTVAVILLAFVAIFGGIYCNKHWDSITYKVKRDLKHALCSCSCHVRRTKNKDVSQNEDAPPSYGKCVV